MSLDISLRFYNSHTIGKPGSFEAIIELFNREGYRIGNIDIPGEHGFIHRNTYDQNAKEILSAAYKYQGMNFSCKDEKEGLEYSVYVGWKHTSDVQPEDTFLGISTDQTALFTREENNPGYYSSLFLNLGKLLFHNVLPDFGWIDMEDFAGSTLDEDISSFSISHVYWANFLGEGYISKYGRERLLRAPVWLSEPLGNIGVLLVLSDILGYYPGKADLLMSYLNKGQEVV